MKKTKAASPVSDDLIGEWLKQGRNPEDVQALLKQFTKDGGGAGHAGRDGRTFGL